MADETFIVLREAMKKTGKVAIARLVLSSRERTVAISARGKGMLVSTLRDPSAVRKTDEYFEEIPAQKADPEMLQLAETLINQKVTEFDFSKYEDRYEVALREMIKQKLKGHKPVIAAEPERGNVINLMDALKASLGQAKPAAPSKSKAKAPAEAAPATAKKAAPKAVAKAKAPAKKRAAG
jgi:DNA end-binding protein Ku